MQYLPFLTDNYGLLREVEVEGRKAKPFKFPLFSLSYIRTEKVLSKSI